MNEFGRYLDGRDRRLAPLVYTKYVSRNPDGSHIVRRTDTDKEVRASHSDPRAIFVPGTVVVCGDPGKSGLNQNTGLVILGLPSQVMKNASAVPTNSDSFDKTAVTVSLISPNPVVMYGGQTKTVVIYGVGFTAPPTYSSTLLTNAVAPVVTPTQITLQVKADLTIPAGRFNLSFGSITIPNLFEVSAMSGHLWVMEESGNFEVKKLNPTDGTLIASSAGLGGTFNRLLSDGDATYLYAVISIPAARVVRIRKSDLQLTNYDVVGFDGGEAGEAVFGAGFLFYTAFALNGLLKWDPSTGLVAQNDARNCNGIVYDGTYIWTAGGGNFNLQRYSPADILTGRVDYPVGTRRPMLMADDGTHLYCITDETADGAARLFKFRKSDGVVVGTDYTGLSKPGGIAYYDGHVYITHKRESAPGELLKIKTSDLTLISTDTNAGNWPRRVAVVSEVGLVWITDANSGGAAGESKIRGYDASDLSEDFALSHFGDADRPDKIIRSAN